MVDSPEISSEERVNFILGVVKIFENLGESLAKAKKATYGKLLIGDSSNKCCRFGCDGHQDHYVIDLPKTTFMRITPRQLMRR